MSEPHGGPAMAYTSDDIRTGAGNAVDAASAGEAVRSLLSGTAVRALAFGDVGKASEFAAVMDTAKGDFARTGYDVHTAHTTLNADATAIAGMGDELVTGTTAIAGGGRAISDGMLG